MGQRAAVLAAQLSTLTAEIASLAQEADRMAARDTEQSSAGSLPRLLSVPEAARAIGVSRSLAYELVRTGELHSVEVRSRTKVPLSAVDNYVTGLMQATA
jgi:excisionase family DNA binding protein